MANAYLEGTYSELYPNVGEGEDGLRELFRQFSYPGGIPSHAAPETPGSIHEGGELGYALVHAFGAAFDNPDLLVACVVGDGEAETGPLAASWHSNKFLNPRRDGAVLPILHLNGWKIANPTVLDRIPESELAVALRGLRLGRRSSSRAASTARSRQPVHERFAAALDRVARRDRADPGGSAAAAASSSGRAGRCSSSGRRRAGRARARSTASRSRERGARTRCRSRASGRAPTSSAGSRTGCAATGPRSSSTRRAGCCRSSPRRRRQASGG